MQVTETLTEGLKREFKIVVPAADIDTRITSRLKELSHTVNLPGFRPGKAPVSLLRKKYGPNVMGEVLETSVNETSQKVIADNEFRVALQPKIEVTKFEEGSELEYTMLVELFPVFEVPDASKIELERLKVDPDEAAIDESLQRIAEAQKTSEPVSRKRKSKSGDLLVIDFVGKVDGEEFDGGKAEGYNLDLGSGTFIPGFEDQLIGVNVGDELTVKVKFPDEYGAENLAGKDAEFGVKVNELRESKPSEINDELAQKVGLEDLGKLREAIAEEQNREYANISRMRLKRDLFDKLTDMYDFELPEGMIDQEFNSVWAQFEETRKNNPDALDEDDKEKTDDELKADYRTLSSRRVRLAVLLSEIGSKNNIEIAQDDMNRAMFAEAQRFPGQEKMVLDYFQKNPEAMESLRGPLYEDKVVDFMVELAKVTDRSVSVEELTEPAEAETKKAPAKKKAAPKKAAAKKPAAKKPAAKKAAAKKDT